MDEKITIIEGPPPTFEAVGEVWALGLNETPQLSGIAITRLRALNGPALVERCHRAWRTQGRIDLEYRSMEGLPAQAPILAARSLQVDDGDVLVLWVRVQPELQDADLADPDDFADDQDDL